MKEFNDRLLLELLKKDDEKAFSLLFESYYVPLCRYARLILKSEQSAEEVVMNVFIYIWENRTRIGIKSSLCAYLFRSVRNRCINYLRDNDPSVYLSDVMVELLCSEENRDMEVEELNHFIEEAILSLPDKCRDVFLKSRNEEMSNREIAEQLNISVKTVEAQITKALKTIRSYITDKMVILWMFF